MFMKIADHSVRANAPYGATRFACKGTIYRAIVSPTHTIVLLFHRHSWP